MDLKRLPFLVAVIAAAGLLVLCKKPGIPPDKPVIVSGPEHGGINTSYEFAATATHPDDEQVAIRFDWGDKVSDWSPFVPSGDTVRMSNTWANPGTYAVKAQARVEAEAESEWSDPVILTILANSPPEDVTITRWPLQVARNRWARFEAVAEDPEGDSIQYLFDYAGRLGS